MVTGQRDDATGIVWHRRSDPSWFTSSPRGINPARAVRSSDRVAVRRGLRPDADHIAHFRKMVSNRVTALGARFLRLLDHRFKIAEVEIFQHPRKITRRP